MLVPLGIGVDGMVGLPSGTVTFLFTDIEGSTARWEGAPEAMREALARHDALLQAAIAGHGGHVVKSTGDGFHAVFARAPDAVATALAAQRRLVAEPRRTPRQQCAAAGGVWDSSLGRCATKTCYDYGGVHRHGDTIVRQSFGELKAKSVTYQCNGFTGSWERVWQPRRFLAPAGWPARSVSTVRAGQRDGADPLVETDTILSAARAPATRPPWPGLFASRSPMLLADGPHSHDWPG
jgi:hypothetical protein